MILAHFYGGDVVNLRIIYYFCIIKIVNSDLPKHPRREANSNN